MTFTVIILIGTAAVTLLVALTMKCIDRMYARHRRAVQEHREDRIMRESVDLEAASGPHPPPTKGPKPC